MLAKWLDRLLHPKGETNPKASEDDTAPVARFISRSPSVIGLVGPSREVEATAWLLAGLYGEDYKFVVGSGSKMLNHAISITFGVDPDSEAVDMFLGVSGAELAAVLNGAIDANFEGLMVRNIEKLRDRIRPDVLVITVGVGEELTWCQDAGGVVIATPGYGGDEEDLRLESIDEDSVAEAVEHLAKGTVATVKRKVAK